MTVCYEMEDVPPLNVLVQAPEEVKVPKYRDSAIDGLPAGLTDVQHFALMPVFVSQQLMPLFNLHGHAAIGRRIWPYE